MNTFAFFDDGSTISVIDGKLARLLGLRGRKAEIKVMGINGESFDLNKCERIDIELVGSFGKKLVKGAVTSTNLKMPTQTLPARLIEEINPPEHVKIDSYYNAQAQILIGQDNWPLLTPETVIPVRGGEFALSRLPLGWVAHGPTTIRDNSRQTNYCIQEKIIKNPKEEYEVLDNLVRQYFELESIGVNIIGSPRSKHDRAISILEKTSRFMGTHWETGLLWKSDEVPDADSYSTAYKRLNSLEKRMERDPEYAKLYRSEMKRFIELGYAVKIDKAKPANRIWYLPHFGVRNINKPKKIRLVFDAAAKTKGFSLNDQLDSGPDLLQPLPGVLIRFRQHAVAFTGDITDMFLRVQVREEDRGAQRFLWWDETGERETTEGERNSSEAREHDVNVSATNERETNKRETAIREPSEYEMTTLIFGSKPSPCSALYIKNKNAETFKLKNSTAHQSIVNDSYMDDYLKSCRSEREAKQLMYEVEKINSIGGFIMHSWISNRNIVEPSRTQSKEKQLGGRENERVLGLVWDTAEDVLRFNVECKKITKDILNGEKIPTKREVLRVVMSVFDPLGLLAPFTLKSKLLMQQIWRSGVHWDHKIRLEEHEKWVAWLQELQKLRDCYVPRCVSTPDALLEHVQLHIFCDASLSAFSAVAYLRFERNCGLKHVALIMAKSRIAPIKPATIPRLELQGALLGTRLAQYIQKECEFHIKKRYFWSDPKTVLSWIKSEPRAKSIFVSSRLGEIAETTQIVEWRWIPTDLNPADDATRFSNNALLTKNRWFHGPSFLYFPEEKWPKDAILNRKDKEEAEQLEVRKTYVGLTQVLPNPMSLTIRLLGWSGLLITARRIRKVISRWKKLEKASSKIQVRRECEKYWFRLIQRESFASEIETLRKGRELKGESKILSLKPYIDEEGILRASGRTKNSRIPEYNKNPIILDAKHFATREFIREYHRRYNHGSVNTVLNEIRQKYLVLGLRNALKTIYSCCLMCRIQRAKPFNPRMANLPLCRLAFRMRAFSYCGLDYFGPLLVKIGRRREKRWGALFTCLTTRAIHIELASSLSADSAIMAIQRMAARRGTPIQIRCDNATNFHGAERELKEAVSQIDNKKIEDYMTNKSIEWVFNSPDSPHMGGAWERLVRSVKTALHVILKEQAPSAEVLSTVLTEIEHSVNSRPLTNVSLDPRDEEALTPNHFLIGTSSGEVQLGRYDETDKCPKKQWKLAQYFADAFWKRWLREYLPTLLPTGKWRNKENDPIKVGDVVLIVDLQIPRNKWKKGEVIRIYPGKDGEVRIADVKTSTNEYTRPTRKLIKLLGINEVKNP